MLCVWLQKSTFLCKQTQVLQSTNRSPAVSGQQETAMARSDPTSDRQHRGAERKRSHLWRSFRIRQDIRFYTVGSNRLGYWPHSKYLPTCNMQVFGVGNKAAKTSMSYLYLQGKHLWNTMIPTSCHRCSQANRDPAPSQKLNSKECMSFKVCLYQQTISIIEATPLCTPLEASKLTMVQL